MSTRSKILKFGLTAIISLVIITSLLNFWLPLQESLRITFGTAFLLFIPGLPWTFILDKKIGLLERMIITIALSIIFVPLAMYTASKMNIKPSTLSITIEILIIVLIPFIIILIKKRK